MTDLVLISIMQSLPSTISWWLLLLPSRGFGKVEKYYKSHAPIRVPCIGVQVGFKDLAMIMSLPMPFSLLFIQFYVVNLLPFAQNIDDHVVYGYFGIIYGPIF